MLEEARAPGCAGAGLGAGSRMVATLRACVTNGAILRTHGERRREQGGRLFGLVLGRTGSWPKMKFEDHMILVTP
jgi:hypothetical protein